MDITDVIGKGPDFPRPIHPDMDRVMEIALQMKAVSEENKHDLEKFHRLWRDEIEHTINFDVLAYQAMQVCFQCYGIETGADWLALKLSPSRFNAFMMSMQAFYDGFLLGARFTQRGGKQ